MAGITQWDKWNKMHDEGQLTEEEWKHGRHIFWSGGTPTLEKVRESLKRTYIPDKKDMDATLKQLAVEVQIPFVSIPHDISDKNYMSNVKSI